METPVLPETINKLRFAADGAFAMLAGMQLDVFTPLKNGPMTADQIANAIGVRRERLRLLLYCLVAAELLREENGRFSNTREANQFLVKDSPKYIGNNHASIAMRWQGALKTAESIRTGMPQAKLDFSTSSSAEVEKFLRTINTRTVRAARALLEKYDFSQVKTLADVGSGGAGLALTITEVCPQIIATAIDLAEVTPIVQKMVEEERAADRVKVVSANVVSGPVPGAYDVAVVRGLVQVLSPDDARLAVKHIGAAVNPGGKIYIIGQILDDSRISPPEAVGFNIAFINAYNSGESYTESQYRDWLNDAGFIEIERSKFLLADASGVMSALKR